MSKPIPFLIQGKNIILVIDGASFTVSKDTHLSYERIVKALKAQEWDTLRDLVDVRQAIIQYANGYVSIVDDEVMWNGQPFHNALSSRMLEMFQQGFPINPMANFMINLKKNSSERSIELLYGFLEKNSLPITDDGCFLAFKKVNKDYTDIYTGQIDNSIGQHLKMDRDLVDDNPDSLCSTGYHFCSLSYLDNFGRQDDPIMIIKINPKDVVSIPTDYNGAKGRCCEYEVVDQVRGNPGEAFNTIVNSNYTPQSDDSNDYWPDTDGELFNVYRRFGDNIDPIAEDLTFEEARELVEKHIRQKKAQLVIENMEGNEVDLTGTVIEFDDDYDSGAEDDEDEEDWYDDDTDDEELFDLVRVKNGNVEYVLQTLEEAQEIMEIHTRGKKAKLKMINQDGNDVDPITGEEI